MQKRFMVCSVIIATLVVAFGCFAAEPQLSVGAASATVNPPIGTYLAGYDLNRASTGVHDDLNVKAVVVSDGATSVALAVVDAISIQYDTTQAIRAAAARLLNNADLPARQIIVQAIHTHAAPDTIGIYGPNETTSGRSPEYMNELITTAAEQIANAARNMRPAKAVYAATQCVGWAVNDSEPEILDNSVAILQFIDTAGKSIATLTNFPCHPTVLDGDNTQTGADWVGTFYNVMNKNIPGQNLFLQGAIGCWIQPKGPVRTNEQAQQYGDDLARVVLAALKDTKPLEGSKVRFASRAFDMPIENEMFKMMTETKLVPRNFGEAVATEAAWFAIGEAQFATHPGETAPMYADQTRQLMDSGPKFILGLGLDHLGYICPPDYFVNTDKYPHAKYLVPLSPCPQAGPVMMEVLRSIIP